MFSNPFIQTSPSNVSSNVAKWSAAVLNWIDHQNNLFLIYYFTWQNTLPKSKFNHQSYVFFAHFLFILNFVQHNICLYCAVHVVIPRWVNHSRPVTPLLNKLFLNKYSFPFFNFENVNLTYFTTVYHIWWKHIKFVDSNEIKIINIIHKIRLYWNKHI